MRTKTKNPAKVRAGNKLKRRLIARLGVFWRGHYSDIGRKGGKATRAKYRLAPIATGGYAMVERETGKVKATIGPVPEHIRRRIIPF